MQTEMSEINHDTSDFGQEMKMWKVKVMQKQLLRRPTINSNSKQYITRK
jgi:hypothetical protein